MSKLGTHGDDVLAALADDVQELLESRAQSIGAIDVAVEINPPYIDGEVLFGEQPDMGFSFDTNSGECRYCELVGDSQERWIEDNGHDTRNDEVGSVAEAILRGLLDARRILRADR